MICVIMFLIKIYTGGSYENTIFRPFRELFGRERNNRVRFELDGNLYKVNDIKAYDYKIKEAYWLAHERLIEKHNPDVIVCESYRLFGHKAKEQSGSSLETAQLIGYLQMVAYKENIPFVLQDPSIKQRFSDEVMCRLGLIVKKANRYFYKDALTNLHMRDAMRHNLYFYKYNMKKLKEDLL